MAWDGGDGGVEAAPIACSVFKFTPSRPFLQNKIS